MPQTGCLTPWAEQGVLLLNATLTVRQGEPMSHYGKGWERFTDAVMASLCDREDPVIFVLWGRSAQEKVGHIVKANKKTKVFLLTAAHPSPLSAYRGFFGCGHFSKINKILFKLKKELIDWVL